MPVELPKSVVLVTGGTGLIGFAIRHVIESEPVGSRFGRREREEWVFVGSKDADLRLVPLQPLRHSIRTSLALLLQGSGAGQKDLQ
jgi:hypothetical protein